MPPFSAHCAWGNSRDDDNYGGSDNYDSNNYDSGDIMIMPSSDMCESAARMCVLMKQKVYMK